MSTIKVFNESKNKYKNTILIIEESAYYEAKKYMSADFAKDTEFMFLGMVEKDENAYIAKRFYLVPNAKNSGVYCESDDTPVEDGSIVSGLQKYINYEVNTLKIPLQDLSKQRIHIHSHVNMGTTPSGTDNKQIEELLNSARDFYIQLIINHRNENTCNIYYNDGISINDVDQFIHIGTSDYYYAIKDKKVVKLKKNNAGIYEKVTVGVSGLEKFKFNGELEITKSGIVANGDFIYNSGDEEKSIPITDSQLLLNESGVSFNPFTQTITAKTDLFEFTNSITPLELTQYKDEVNSLFEQCGMKKYTYTSPYVGTAHNNYYSRYHGSSVYGNKYYEDDYDMTDGYNYGRVTPSNYGVTKKKEEEPVATVVTKSAPTVTKVEKRKRFIGKGRK